LHSSSFLPHNRSAEQMAEGGKHYTALTEHTLDTEDDAEPMNSDDLLTTSSVVTSADRTISGDHLVHCATLSEKILGESGRYPVGTPPLGEPTPHVVAEVVGKDSESTTHKTKTETKCLRNKDAFNALLAGGWQVGVVTWAMFFVCCGLITETTDTAVTACTNSSNHSCTSAILGGNHSHNLTGSKPSSASDPYRSLWTILKITSSLLYTANGMVNLHFLAVGVEKKQITPYMAYINSFMCWSAVVFGPLQMITDIIVPALGYEWTLKFDYWYTLPNFAWAVEWGWQLFDSNTKKGCNKMSRVNPPNCNKPANKTTYCLGIRGMLIMLASIVSIGIDCRYLGGLIFPVVGVACPAGSRHPGYDVAFALQAAAAIVMAIACLCKYRTWKAFLSFGLFLVGFLGFVLLQDLHHHLASAITETHWFETVKEVGIKICDNTQINFSIWFFVFMFQHKYKSEFKILNTPDKKQDDDDTLNTKKVTDS